MANFLPWNKIVVFSDWGLDHLPDTTGKNPAVSCDTLFQMERSSLADRRTTVLIVEMHLFSAFFFLHFGCIYLPADLDLEQQIQYAFDIDDMTGKDRACRGNSLASYRLI